MSKARNIEENTCAPYDYSKAREYIEDGDVYGLALNYLDRPANDPYWAQVDLIVALIDARVNQRKREMEQE